MAMSVDFTARIAPGLSGQARSGRLPSVCQQTTQESTIFRAHETIEKLLFSEAPDPGESFFPPPTFNSYQ